MNHRNLFDLSGRSALVTGAAGGIDAAVAAASAGQGAAVLVTDIDAAAAGPVPALLPPPVIAEYDPPMGAVPGLGQHTDRVLAEFGFGEHEIVRLRDQGAIGPAYH